MNNHVNELLWVPKTTLPHMLSSQMAIQKVLLLNEATIYLTGKNKASKCAFQVKLVNFSAWTQPCEILGITSFKGHKGPMKWSVNCFMEFLVTV